MSPALIRQLIDIATLPEPELHSGCVESLILDKLIEWGSQGGRNRPVTTEAGAAYLTMLCRTPLPIQVEVWVDPRTKEQLQTL